MPVPTYGHWTTFSWIRMGIPTLVEVKRRIFCWYSRLTTYQKPTFRLIPVKLVACEYTRMIGQQLLQQVFGLVGLFSHLHGCGSVLKQEDGWHDEERFVGPIVARFRPQVFREADKPACVQQRLVSGSACCAS
jgi:hypothetical protein